MAMMIYPQILINTKAYKSRGNINSDLEYGQDYYTQYVNNQPPKPGDLPAKLNISDRFGFPDAVGQAEFWMFSPRLFDFIQQANGPDWPLRGVEMTYRTKDGAEALYFFLWGPQGFIATTMMRPHILIQGSPSGEMTRSNGAGRLATNVGARCAHLVQATHSSGKTQASLRGIRFGVEAISAGSTWPTRFGKS